MWTGFMDVFEIIRGSGGCIGVENLWYCYCEKDHFYRITIIFCLLWIQAIDDYILMALSLLWKCL